MTCLGFCQRKRAAAGPRQVFCRGKTLKSAGKPDDLKEIKSHKSEAFAGAKAELYREQARKLRIENDREENRC